MRFEVAGVPGAVVAVPELDAHGLGGAKIPARWSLMGGLSLRVDSPESSARILDEEWVEHDSTILANGRQALEVQGDADAWTLHGRRGG